MTKPWDSPINAVVTDLDNDDIIIGQPRVPPGFHLSELGVQGASTQNVVSIDLGENDFLSAGFRRHGVTTESSITISTKQYYCDAKIQVTQQRLNRMVRANANIRRLLPSFIGFKKTGRLFLLTRYIRNVSENFYSLHGFYGRRKMRRLRFTREMGKDKTVDRYARMLVNKARENSGVEVAVVFGDAMFRSRRGFKKHGRPSYNRLIHACRKLENVQVRVVRECYSSSFCHRCFKCVNVCVGESCTDHCAPRS